MSTSQGTQEKKVYHNELYVRLDNEYYEVHCNIIKRTEKAVLIETLNIESEVEKIWIPLSQIKVIHTALCNTGYLSHIVVANWLLRKAGLV